MTFSDPKVVDYIKEHFVPAWESVADVTTVTYPLSEDRSVKQVLSGEIAVYFCRPDGRVFDMLLGLQSPEDTLTAMQEAMALFEQTDGGWEVSELKQFHREAMATPILATPPQSPLSDPPVVLETRDVLEMKLTNMRSELAGLERRLRELSDSPDKATQNKRNSKNLTSVMVAHSMAYPLIPLHEKRFMTVVDPAGRNHRRHEVHALLTEGDGLKQPADLKNEVFEDLLAMPLSWTES